MSKAEVIGCEQKPETEIVLADGIPFELREKSRWLGWVWNWDGEHQGKLPVCARHGGAGSSTNPLTWCDFQTAIDAHHAGDIDGIGFVLGNGYFGIDLDDCRDPMTGELSPLALEIVNDVPAYWEVSPSRTGIKGIGSGKAARRAWNKRRRNRNLYWRSLLLSDGAETSGHVRLHCRLPRATNASLAAIYRHRSKRRPTISIR